MDILEMLKPQLDSMNEMYQVGFKAGLAEGERRAKAKMSKEIKKILESFPKEENHETP